MTKATPDWVNMMRCSSMLIRFLCIAPWAVLLLYSALFQFVAVGLHPKLFIEVGPSAIDGFLNSPVGKFREIMKPIWLGNGLVVIALFVSAGVLTIMWLLLKTREKNGRKTLVQTWGSQTENE